MKRVGYITDKDGRRITLLEAMGDYGNVQKAYNKARKCKRHRKDVLIFTKDKEENLDKVREDIINLAYEPSKYHYFKVYEPKERQIMALPSSRSHHNCIAAGVSVCSAILSSSL